MFRLFTKLFLALCFFLPSTARAYTYLEGSPRWAFTKMPVPWYVSYTDSSNWGGKTLEELKSMVEQAFGIWEDVDCSFMMFRYMGITKSSAIKGDSRNVIEWVAELPDGASESAVGLGGPLFTGKGDIYEGNVWIKSGKRSDKDGSVLLAHEVGHAIGFGHTDAANAIMYPSYNSKTALAEDDIKGLCNAYPMSANRCTESANCPKGLLCLGGQCSKCKADRDCDSLSYCDRGLCLPLCKSDDDCSPKGVLCKDQRCVHCKTDEECGTTRFCDQDLCQDKCKVDTDCAADELCRENGRCVKRGGCIKNEDCKTTEYCQGQACVSRGSLSKPCQGAGDCAAGQTCVTHLCKVDLDCLEGFTCKLDAGSTEGSCVGSDQKAASICAILCKDSAKEMPCPPAFSCLAFTPAQSFCYPPARTLPPTPPPPPTEPPPTGCSCSSDPSSSLGFFPWFLLGLVLFLRRGRKSTEASRVTSGPARDGRRDGLRGRFEEGRRRA